MIPFIYLFGTPTDTLSLFEINNISETANHNRAVEESTKEKAKVYSANSTPHRDSVDYLEIDIGGGTDSNVFITPAN